MSSVVGPRAAAETGEVVGRGKRWKRAAPGKEISILAVRIAAELKVTVGVKVTTFKLHL